MTEEMLIDGLALIGAGTVLYVTVRVLGAIAAWAQRTPEVDAAAPPQPATPVPVSVPLAPPVAAVAEDVAEVNPDIVVIAAAVYAMLESHRIVHIQDAHSGQTWSAEGRWMHQTSHRTH